ncbi:3'-5' exonuclease [Vibrio mediterranei]
MRKISFFDSETTGLGSDAEIVELSLVGVITGEVYLDTLVKPLSPIPEDATAIHGITNRDVESAPSWDEVYGQFCQRVDGRTVHIYNADYDVRMVSQTSALYQLEAPIIKSRCVMRRYAALWREADAYSGGWRLAVAKFDQRRSPATDRRLGVGGSPFSF